MSNEYCVGVIGLRNDGRVQNPISFHGITYECLIQVNPKIFLLDVKNTPEFYLKTTDNNTRLELFFQPWLNGKCVKRGSKHRIVEQFFRIPDGSSNVSSENASVTLTPTTIDVYSMLHEAHVQECKMDQRIKLPPFFLPTLRTYQSNALQWMLSRERVKSYRLQEFVPVKCHSISNKTFYFNDRTDELMHYEPHLELPTGGILADEMGLGKTVEILALILSNPNLKRKFEDRDEPVRFSYSMQTEFLCICRDTKSNDMVLQCSKCLFWQHAKCVAKYSNQPILNYICPKCWKLEEPVHSMTTFIACPSSIKGQWNNEIRRHISSPNFKIFDYNGISQSGWISPSDLAKYDVVLCDYATMRKEIHYTGEKIAHNTRGRKSVIPESPLTKLCWWRVVLDEAQMVESPSNQYSKMVKNLPAVHRWAVTGTPIEKSIDDLYGLMVFLDCEPYTDWNMWKKLSDAFKNGNARPLIDQCLKNIMWRTSKVNVSTELAIPKQQEIVHNVKMNELEAKFYFDQHLKCETEFHQTVTKLTRSSKGLKMNLKTLKIIMEPLRKLRRDCTVPTVVQERFGGLSAVHKLIKTPAELYKHMVQENERACKLALKTIAAYSNVLAERLPKGNTNVATEMYKHVLTLVKDCTDYVSITSMSPLKSLRNLLEIAESSDENLLETKAECLQQIERLERSHLLPINDSLKEIREKQKNLENEIAVRGNDVNTIGWWNDVFNDIEDMERRIVQEINQTKWSASVTSFYDIRVRLHSWLEKIETKRAHLKDVFNEHDFFTTRIKVPILLSEKETSNQIDDHHDDEDLFGNNSKTSMQDSLGLLLRHKTKVRKILEDYQSVIFDCDRKRSNEEEMLRAIFAVILDEPSVDHNTIDNANKHFEVLALLKKEFKEYNSFLLKVEEGIDLSNELRVPTPLMDDIESKTQLELRLKKQTADGNFNKSFQILKYVKHLESSQLDVECPICFELPTATECVLQCGHKMCCACFVEMRKHNPIKYACHSCRNIQYTDNTYQVFKNIDADTDQAASVVPIIGDYSRKIQEIVRTALDLLKSDPDVKILIFSHWDDVLKIIGDALHKNGVQCRRKSTKFDKCIGDFKSKNLMITCLLLPLSCGSKGLNLVEATHIFLVEPILDPAEELQAIGRIHRIGQIKPTFVHRFIVLKTIEETISTTVSKDMAGKWKTANLTVDNLREFFTQYRQIN